MVGPRTLCGATLRYERSTLEPRAPRVAAMRLASALDKDIRRVRGLALARKIERQRIALALGPVHSQLVRAPTHVGGNGDDDEDGEADDIAAIALPQLGEVLAP